MSIGSRIKEARLRKGLRQDELAGLVGVQPSAISNYESDTSRPMIPPKSKSGVKRVENQKNLSG